MTTWLKKTCRGWVFAVWRGAGRLLPAGVLAAGLAVVGGCKPDVPPPAARGHVGGLEAQGISPEDLLKTALFNLNHLEEFASEEMREQVVERFNQWIQSEQPLPDWKPDPLLAGLPKHLGELPDVKGLDKLVFPRSDAFPLQAAVWLRDLSAWTRGDTLEELQQARRLFDWTVRNIQIDPTPVDADGRAMLRVRQIPWETLLFGRGTPVDRAWVFILLAQQQGIDACVLALPGHDDPEGKQLQTWAVAVRSGSELYLFDPALGLPIPAPGEIKLGSDGQLDIRPATLGQLAADDSLLRRMDLGPERTYPVKAGDVQRVVALVEGSPWALSMRMRLLEDHLAGVDKMVLSTAPTVQAKRLAAVTPPVKDARLWTLPYATILQRMELGRDAEFVRQQLLALMPFHVDPNRSLWKGRVLHLRGKLRGEQGATAYYQASRPADAQLDAFQKAQKVPPGAQEMFVRAKQDASYWLGLVSFELGNYPAAVDYFVKRTLEASPDGPWTHGAKYNLGRTYEAAGQYDQAAGQYEGDQQSPGYHGNALRARWLRAAIAQGKDGAKKGEPGGANGQKEPAPKSRRPAEAPQKQGAQDSPAPAKPSPRAKPPA